MGREWVALHDVGYGDSPAPDRRCGRTRCIATSRIIPARADKPTDLPTDKRGDVLLSSPGSLPIRRGSVQTMAAPTLQVAVVLSPCGVAAACRPSPVAGQVALGDHVYFVDLVTCQIGRLQALAVASLLDGQAARGGTASLLLLGPASPHKAATAQRLLQHLVIDGRVDNELQGPPQRIVGLSYVELATDRSVDLLEPEVRADKLMAQASSYGTIAGVTDQQNVVGLLRRGDSRRLCQPAGKAGVEPVASHTIASFFFAAPDAVSGHISQAECGAPAHVHRPSTSTNQTKLSRVSATADSLRASRDEPTIQQAAQGPPKATATGCLHTPPRTSPHISGKASPGPSPAAMPSTPSPVHELPLAPLCASPLMAGASRPRGCPGGAPTGPRHYPPPAVAAAAMKCSCLRVVQLSLPPQGCCLLPPELAKAERGDALSAQELHTAREQLVCLLMQQPPHTAASPGPAAGDHKGQQPPLHSVLREALQGHSQALVVACIASDGDGSAEGAEAEQEGAQQTLRLAALMRQLARPCGWASPSDVPAVASLAANLQALGAGEEDEQEPLTPEATLHRQLVGMVRQLHGLEDKYASLDGRLSALGVDLQNVRTRAVRLDTAAEGLRHAVRNMGSFEGHDTGLSQSEDESVKQ